MQQLICQYQHNSKKETKTCQYSKKKTKTEKISVTAVQKQVVAKGTVDPLLKIKWLGKMERLDW